jgi:hypothetical protein
VFALPGKARAEVVIRLAPGEPSQVQVTGLSPGSLSALTDAPLDRSEWQQVFALFVASNSARATTPVLGDYAVQNDCLTFTPRFPLRPGLTYCAVFDSAAIPGQPQHERRIEVRLSVPGPPSGRPTEVEAVYPSSEVLPENLLKFYVHFSAPMSRGESYQHIRLLDAQGATVDAPFLELAEELWDDAGQRLTLLLDPGRVKQDLKPHVDVGRAITFGGTYVLAISPDWRDAHGAPLGRRYRKRFSVAAPDVRQPDPQQWQLTSPGNRTQEPLIVEFNEPLDQAMLQHVIRVVNAAGSELDGQITVDQRETRWSFRPATSWRAGIYRLVIDATLEDLAGNSIERPFELHLPGGRPAVVKQYAFYFEKQED